MPIWCAFGDYMKKYMGSVEIDIPIEAIEKNAREAHKLLNMQIVADCTPLVPFEQGGLRGSVNYPQGIYGDEIEWNTPYAHYQYVGDLYLTPDGRSFANRGEKKFPTGIPLKHRVGTSNWFEVAESQHLTEWVDMVKKVVGNA